MKKVGIRDCFHRAVKKAERVAQSVSDGVGQLSSHLGSRATGTAENMLFPVVPAHFE